MGPLSGLITSADCIWKIGKMIAFLLLAMNSMKRRASKFEKRDRKSEFEVIEKSIVNGFELAVGEQHLCICYVGLWDEEAVEPASVMRLKCRACIR